MVETLERFIQQAADYPRHSRNGLYKELLQTPTFILNLGAPIQGEPVTRLTWSNESFDIWADKDPELGGIWVPVFAARDTVAEYVQAKRLQAPEGKEFLWMEHGPGQVFSLLRGVECFAGLTLYLDSKVSISIPWSDVKALSEGRVPSDGPEIYDLPVEKLAIPEGTKVVFGKVDSGQAQGRLLCVPEAGHFRAEDTRKLVRLDIGEGPAWIACRHLLQALKFFKARENGDAGRYVEDVLHCLVRFQMYGEAEALCDWLGKNGNEAFSWVYLAAIYGKTGKLADCAELCRRGARKYPEEKAFWVNGARALFGLGRPEEARTILAQAMERFPHDVLLLQMRANVSAAGGPPTLH